MAKELIVPHIVTDQVPIRYVETPDQLAPLFRSFENYVEQFKDRRERMDVISESFIHGTLDMISGDLKFEQGQHQEAIPDLNRATESFQKSGSLLNKGEFQFPFNLKHELDRRALYCQARVTHAEALSTLKKGFSDKERIMVKNLLELALIAYQEEIQLNQKNDDFFHMLLALRNFYKVKIRISEQDSDLSKNLYEKRRNLYKSMTHARKATFLGEKRIPKTFFSRTSEKIRHLTINKFLDRADNLWQMGLDLSAKKDFVAASSYYWNGVSIYKEIQRLERKQEYQLQGLMFQVTGLENDARLMLSLDRNKEASDKFNDASELMSKLISTVKELGNADLVNLFQIQSQYFDGMKLFCSGLLSMDDDNNESALQSLKGSQRMLKVVLNNARELDNKPLIQSCKDGLKKIETYVETLELLVE